MKKEDERRTLIKEKIKKKRRIEKLREKRLKIKNFKNTENVLKEAYSILNTKICLN